MFSKILIGLFALTVAATVYVRLAPTDIAGVHTNPEPRAPGDYPSKVGFEAVRQITTQPQTILDAITRAALGTPRTQRVAGSVDDGMITFETRSRIMGYPDYTTVSIIQTDDAPLLSIRGRLTYGSADLGVNEARVRNWLEQLGPLTVAP